MGLSLLEVRVKSTSGVPVKRASLMENKRGLSIALYSHWELDVDQLESQKLNREILEISEPEKG
jgi:hypothetical protein